MSSRLEELERAAGAGGCEACGAPPPGRQWPNDTPVTIDTSSGPFVPRYCSKCGRQLNFTFNIGTPGKDSE